jgi:hypothetical protein
MSVSFESRLVQPEDVLFQELEDESILLNVTTGEYYGLNPSGHRMWAALTTSDSIRDAYEQLLASYDVPADDLKLDLIELISNLLNQRLVRIDDA